MGAEARRAERRYTHGSRFLLDQDDESGDDGGDLRGDVRGDAHGGAGFYDLLRPLIFRLPPETAHHVTLALLRAGGAVAPARWMLAPLSAAQAERTVQAFGLTFANPVGLGCGL